MYVSEFINESGKGSGKENADKPLPRAAHTEVRNMPLKNRTDSPKISKVMGKKIQYIFHLLLKEI